MTPKEKAEQLADYYMPFCSNNYNNAKQCALIAVNEILEICVDSLGLTELDYWQEVKQEIELL